MTAAGRADGARRQLAVLQRAVSCVSDAVLFARPGGSRTPSEVYRVSPSGNVPLQLRGRITLEFSMDLYYQLAVTASATGRLDLIGYRYSLADGTGREILAYHWHPEVPAVTYPHLHIGHGAVQAAVLDRAGLSPAHNALLPEIAGAHLPTGAIELSSVLRLAIEHLGVEPRRGDWASILR